MRLPRRWACASLVLLGGWAFGQTPSSATGTQPAPIAVGVYFNENRIYVPADQQAFADLQDCTGRLATCYLNFQTWTGEWNKFATRLADNARIHGGGSA